MQRLHSVSPINGTDSESQAVKPLPPLPRGWSRVCHETGLVLRGIGLGIVVTSFQGLFTKNFSEPEKVAIRRSRVTALLRTLIHAVPIGVAIFEIVLNLKGHFVGRHFGKQNYLQFAAKAHEITLQASVATIVLSYIRYQISAGRGMPFGAVLSGLQFLQVSYLWSVELWSSILSKDFQPRKKICFAVLILICVTIAATAGPSSASLLIPRQGLWPTASAYLAVNASAQDIWPDQLDGNRIERDCAMVRPDSPNDTLHCPLADLYHLLEAENMHQLVDGMSAHTLDYSPLQQSGSYLQKFSISSTCSRSSMDQFCASASQARLLDGFVSIAASHFRELVDIEGYQFMRKNYFQPYTIASCVADVVKDDFDQAPLRFPRISETVSKLKKDREIVSIPGLTKGQIVKNVSGNGSDFRVDWIDLPLDLFSTGIPGAVIVNSQELNGSSYNIVTCTLNAGWGSSAAVSVSEDFEKIYSHMSNIPSSWSNENIDMDAHGYMFMNPPTFANISNFSYPQRRISISKNWMEFLNPTIVMASNSTGKFISLLLSSLQSYPTESDVAQLLTLFLANAMAENGREYAWGVFPNLINATRSCDTCTFLEIEYWLFGWLYSASGTTTILAITVMLAYCVLVFGHIIYSAISGVSSTAWDSTAELVALAMNSSPTKTLQNTCAGIVGRQALKTSVRVLATAPGHLELVFGEVKDPNGQTSKLVMNQKYGKLTDDDGDEDEELDLNAQATLRKRAAAQSSE